jgi:hypothetical protein
LNARTALPCRLFWRAKGATFASRPRALLQSPEMPAETSTYSEEICDERSHGRAKRTANCGAGNARTWPTAPHVARIKLEPKASVLPWLELAATSRRSARVRCGSFSDVTRHLMDAGFMP